MAECEEINKYFEVAKKLALEAGEVFKSALRQKKTVTTKHHPQDLLTEYDTKIENMLISGLSAEFPDHKFIAEESSAEKGSLAELTEAPTWFIDPIDGTTNFVHGFTQCCISIGLTVGKRLQLGIIYNPPSNEMYTAIRGQGAFLNDVPIQTSKNIEMNNSLVSIEAVMIASPTNRDIIVGRFEAIALATMGMRSIGSAALSLAYVAAGTLDIFQHDRLAPWDVAAGQIILEEAGGFILDTKGGPLDMMKPKPIAAATEVLAREVSKLIVDTDLITQRKRLKRVPSSTKLV